MTYDRYKLDSGREDDAGDCTCRMSRVWSNSTEPPHVVRDDWCPVHGRDPDEAYERMRDDADWDAVDTDDDIGDGDVGSAGAR